MKNTREKKPDKHNVYSTYKKSPNQDPQTGSNYKLQYEQQHKQSRSYRLKNNNPKYITQSSDITYMKFEEIRQLFIDLQESHPIIYKAW